jgi:hypothetical protein
MASRKDGFAEVDKMVENTTKPFPLNASGFCTVGDEITSL